MNPHSRPAHIEYVCSNCRSGRKVFSIIYSVKNDEKPKGRIVKVGEFPRYGVPTPARLIKLIGPDRDLFLKGRRCENDGLGIGAFVYYRRVVENQKDRILDEIIRVLDKLPGQKGKAMEIGRAKKETQFSTAMDIAKDAMPESLLINGINPLRLLHSALSEGVHALSDEDCLELATSIRVVLRELSERLSQALKDEAEVQSAIARLSRT